MKIYIKLGGREFTIPAPLSLALKFLSRGSFDKVGSGVEISEVQAEEAKKQLKTLAKGIKEAKKQWGHLTIVEVKSADGDEVTITL